jgi:predicted CXXCH cytochrome family protein
MANEENTTVSVSRGRFWPILILGLALVIGLLAVAHYWNRRPESHPTVDARDGSSQHQHSPDPRLTFNTPFRNVRPEVKYVGDEVCGRCHPKIAESYAQHPMGRSLAPVAQAGSSERYDAAAHNPFTVDGFTYAVERRGDKVFHRQFRPNPEGGTLTDLNWEVAYTVGSGNFGRTYLFERDGVLLESPLTWYPRKGIWDLSPGYAKENLHFSRPVTGECLFCHCNYADRIENTYNRYRQPIFHGYSIGCERCHGPGELHVARRERDENPMGMDDAIVNPKHLQPLLRDSICEQCHLQGQRRIPKRDRGTYDFRPGLPLHLFMSVFVKPPELNDNGKFVGQVEQMHLSKCFQKSNGKLGCISCHDPHRQPKPEERVSFYRQRCLSCHETLGGLNIPAGIPCSLAKDERLKQSPQDSCIQCHMPTRDADIRHTSFSDHRVVRRPDPTEDKSSKPPQKLKPGEMPIVHFHRAHADPKDPEIKRDLGIGLMELSRHVPATSFEKWGELALPLLEPAVARAPEDLDAMDANAHAYVLLARYDEAAELLERVLKLAPEREPTLDSLGYVYVRLGRHGKAIECWKKAIETNPHRWRYYVQIAAAHGHLREWTQALYAADQAIKLHPTSVDARITRVTGLLMRGDKRRAEEEFNILLALDPPNPEALKARYEEIKIAASKR